MDELDLLTRRHADVPAPDDDALAAARARLVARMGTGDTRSRHRGRIAIAMTAAAAVAAGVVVLTNLDEDKASPTGQPTTAQAAPRVLPVRDYLTLAATTALRTGDPRPGRGRYTYVRTHAWEVLNEFRRLGTPAPGEPQELSTTDPVTILVENRYEVWAPSDPDGTWYWRYRRTSDVRFLSAADERYVREHSPQLLEPRTETYQGDHGQITGLLGPGQKPPGGPESSGRVPVTWGVPTPAFLAAQPRDPQALLRRLYVDPNKPTPTAATRDGYAFLHLSQVLSSGLVPADLRAALYRAATLIPGVRVTDAAVTIDGRHGVALGRADATNTFRIELIFAADGRFLGERYVLLRTGGNHAEGYDYNAPAGTVVHSTAVTVGIANKPNLP